MPLLIAPGADIYLTWLKDAKKVETVSPTLVEVTTALANPMCSICAKVLGTTNLCAPHDELYCPLSQADYCGICATYGHTTEYCGQKLTLMYRQPQYFEQILHPGELKNYGMEETMTPLPSAAKPMELPKDPRMVIPEYDDPHLTDKAIRGVLLAHNYQPGNMKKNKDLIDRLARAKGFRLVFRKV